MAGFTSISMVKERMEKDLIEALATLGYYAMMDAYKKRTFKHRTRNLHDSYGCGVYYHGKLVLSSIRYLGGMYSKKRDPKTKKTGRETLNDYLKQQSFGEKNNEIVLVVVAAMYYAGILEKADKGNPRRGPGKKYIVISPARKYIADNYWTALYKVYDKYGLKGKPKTRVVEGERLRRIDYE